MLTRIACLWMLTAGMFFMPFAGANEHKSLLPVIIKARAIIGTSGRWDSRWDPDFYSFVQKACVDIEMTNASTGDLENLRLAYFIYAVSHDTRDIYIAGVGAHAFSLKKLETVNFRTDKSFFSGARTAYEYLANYRTGDKFYGYVVSVWQGDELAGFSCNPRTLNKTRKDLLHLRKHHLRERSGQGIKMT